MRQWFIIPTLTSRATSASTSSGDGTAFPFPLKACLPCVLLALLWMPHPSLSLPPLYGLWSSVFSFPGCLLDSLALAFSMACPVPYLTPFSHLTLQCCGSPVGLTCLVLAGPVAAPTHQPMITLMLSAHREDWKPVLTINSIIYGLQYLFLVSRDRHWRLRVCWPSASLA